MKHVVILGAGISGLAAGWFLKQKYPSLSITILEKSSRCGGWIKSVQTDGFLFELGPRSCRPSSRTLQLIQDLHLQNEVLPGHAQAKIRYLYRHQRLQALPQNFLSLMCSSLFPTVIKGAAKDLLTKRSLEEDETIESFVTRRLGPTIAHELFDPLTTGIYAGDMRQLSMKACFPQMYEWEQKKGSLIRGALSQPKPKMQTSFERQLAKGSLFSFKKGMETLTEALAKKLERHIWLDTSVHRLPFDRADHVISALPAQALGSLLSKEHPAIAHQLSSFESESITVVNLGFHNRILAQEGFGYLIPRLENEDILGVVFDSSVFPEQGLGTRLTVMIKQQVENPVDVALRSLHKHLGIQRIPDTYYVHRALQAIPQYKVGHTEKVRKIEEMIRMQGLPLSLLGSAFNGVSVNDCIANAYQLVDSFNLKSS